jgi:hypothetical protein
VVASSDRKKEITMKGRFMAAGTAAAALAGAGVVVVSAQEPAPTVAVTVTSSKMTVSGAEALRPGPVRLALESPGRRARDFTVFELKQGVSVDDVQRRLRTLRAADAAERYGKLVGGGAVARGASYTTTFEAKAGTYLLLDTTQQPALRAHFTVGGEQSTAVAAQPDRTVGLREYRFEMAATLPRRGVVRFANRGEELHFALALRLERGTSTGSVVRQLRQGRERIAGLGVGTEPLGLVSGDTVNDVEVRFQPGRYVLVCLYGDRESRNRPHSTLGMARGFRVR